MIRLDKYRLVSFLLAFITCFSFTACNKENENDYDFSRITTKVELNDNDTIDGFALRNNLCVLGNDEHGLYEQEHLDYVCGIFDLNNKETLYAQGVFEKLEPASLTKVLTAYCALKYGNLDDEIIVSDIVNLITDPGASTCNFNEGDKLTLRQLLYCFLVHSGNEIGNVIAEYISGDIESFAQLMNEEAAKLGATHTHFTNPHGLSDPNHYTTAYDLYLIFNEAIKNKDFLDMISTKTYTCTYTDATGATVTQEFNNTNRFLHNEYLPGYGITVVGGKTGSTNEAGMCLVVLAYDEQNNPYISIVMHATSRVQLYQAHQMLMWLI